MAAGMLDVLSVLDSNEEPVYGNCTLQMGDVALEFKNGRSKTTVDHAPEVLRNPNCLIPGYTGPAAPPVPSVAMELAPDLDMRQHPQETPQQREDRIRAAEEYLRSQGLPIPAREAPAPAAGTISVEEAQGLAARITELERMLQEAVELRGPVFDPAAAPTGAIVGDVDVPEGVVPGETPGWPVDAVDGKVLDLTPEERERLAQAALDEETIPAGIAPKTADGKPRCWVRKADGSQCSNASADGSHVCALAAHQKKIAQ
jgi:hypothetical protein